MKILKIALILFFSFLAAAALTLWHFSPLFNPFPQPTGPYGLGIISLQLKDPNRSEIHSHSMPRELVVDFYYPAQIKKNEQFAYQPDVIQAVKTLRSKDSHSPAFVWNCLLDGMQSYAEPYASIAQSSSPFPAIIFSHGIGSYAFYSVYLEELASQGYIVAFVHHPYDTQVTVFPDKRLIEMAQEFREILKSNDPVQISNYRAQAHAIWVKDIQFVMDCLDELNKHNVTELYQKIDLNRIGVMGHSHGGGVAIDVCKIDPRCKAGIDLDGWTKTANTTQGFAKQFLFLLQQGGLDDSVEKLSKNIPNSSVIKIPGAEHRAFSDFILFKWPLSRVFGITTGDPIAVRKEIQAKIRQFWAQNL